MLSPPWFRMLATSDGMLHVAVVAVPVVADEDVTDEVEMMGLATARRAKPSESMENFSIFKIGN